MGKHRKLKVRQYKFLLVIGELLITSGLVLGLYVAYELWGSNVVAEQSWSSSADQLLQDFAAADGTESDLPELTDPASPAPSRKPIALSSTPTKGKAFALMYLPKLWGNRPVPIVEGTDTAELAKGIGHYTTNVLPGEVGNFAVAGHRATHGEPFANFPKLAAGDQVVIQTLAGKYTYKLVANQKITPDEGWVLDNQPANATLDQLPAGSKIITLTTCDPRWSSERRWAWWGVLDSFVPAVTPTPTPTETTGATP